MRTVPELLQLHFLLSAPVLTGELVAIARVAMRVFGDFESFVIFCTVFQSAIAVQPHSGVRADTLLAGDSPPLPSSGWTTRSVADFLGLSRETVRRRIGHLVDRG